MIDIGEDLVGAYLSKVRQCQVVEFNVRTGLKQAEIDVVGLKLDGTSVTEAWLCEVSTHTGGLGGYKGDVAGKFDVKLQSVRAYAAKELPGIPHHLEVWSPKVTPATLKKLEPVWGHHAEVELVANEDYAARVRELCEIAKKQTAYSDSPSFRLLQILTRLSSNPLP